jgi:hypothetical protein
MLYLTIDKHVASYQLPGSVFPLFVEGLTIRVDRQYDMALIAFKSANPDFLPPSSIREKAYTAWYVRAVNDVLIIFDARFKDMKRLNVKAMKP